MQHLIVNSLRPYLISRTTLASYLQRVRNHAPALLFALRLAASVSLALYIAFWLQLDNAYWAAASAAAVSHPILGASLRKGWYRMIGTLAGGSFIVVLTACCIQHRTAFLIGLALWGAACAFLATLLRNFASYGAALAGFTAVIIASDILGAVGGANGDVFMVAVTRATEICIGITSAGVVLAATDLGGAQRRLGIALSDLSSEITTRFVESVTTTISNDGDRHALRREFARRVVALDPAIDQAIGESSQLRLNSPHVQRAVSGLIDALAGWQATATHLSGTVYDRPARQELGAILKDLSRALREAAPHDSAHRGSADPQHLRLIYRRTMHALTAAPIGGASRQLLFDQATIVLAGVSQSLSGLAVLLGEPPSARVFIRSHLMAVSDWAPPLINACRAFLAISVAELLWVLTAWPSGLICVIWTAITIILFGPRADQAYASVMRFLVGCSAAVVLAAVVKFAVLPQLESFTSVCTVLACFLIPVGALSAVGWQSGVTAPMAVIFVALLALENATSYDTVQFYNASLALFAGSGIAVLAFRLVPPQSPEVKSRRLLALTLRDLRLLAGNLAPDQYKRWKHLIYIRLFDLPDAAKPVQRSQMVAALVAGTEMARLHRMVGRRSLSAPLKGAFDAVARGESALARAELAHVDQSLVALQRGGKTRPRAHSRASLLALSEILVRHAGYFDECRHT
jgi:uncharacterized membrane protein YccC